MKTSLEHLPERKLREISRIVEIIHEEFEDALAEAKSETRRRGRILKIILFGSYAKGTWVDEPHTMKGYRSDYDILVIVNERRFAEYSYWDRATDRLNRDPGIGVPVGLIVHSGREVNNFLRNAQYFFTDIRKEGIVLYEMDDRELAEPGILTAKQAAEVAAEHCDRSPDPCWGRSLRSRQARSGRLAGNTSAHSASGAQRQDSQGQRLSPNRRYSRLGTNPFVPLPSPFQWN